MSQESNQKTNDAFLSYAHEDLGSVEWLGRLLTSYWVPGRKQRRIFRDRDQITAEGLGKQIFAALRSSRYLIVCWSEQTSASSWVQQEVAAFLQDHPPEQVLVCRVGELKNPPPPLPSFLEALWEGAAAERPYVPDLRGFPERVRGRQERQRYREEALTLLAPLVGLASKDKVLARRARSFWALAAAVGGVAAALSLAFLVWNWWLTTPNGRFFDLTRSLSAEIAGQELNEPLMLAPAARALGRLDRRDLLERFAAVTSDSSFRAQFLAGGYASLPQPDCQAARARLVTLSTSDEGATEVSLLVEAHCSGAEPTAPTTIALPTDPARRAALLAQTGFLQQAEEILRSWSGSAVDLLPVLVDVTLAKGGEVAGDYHASLEAWRNEQDAHSVAVDVLGWLKLFDQKDLLALPLARQLQKEAGAQLARLEPDYGNSWALRQQLAAHRARSGESPLARQLIAATDPRALNVATPRVYEDSASGWAWRGLALLRLGDRTSAEAAFDKAFKIASRPALQSRTYEEWPTLAFVFALADDWRRTFETFHAPADGRARTIQGLKLIELWAARKARRQEAMTVAGK